MYKVVSVLTGEENRCRAVWIYFGFGVNRHGTAKHVDIQALLQSGENNNNLFKSDRH